MEVGAGERESPAQGLLMTWPCSLSGACGPRHEAAGLALRLSAGQALPGSAALLRDEVAFGEEEGHLGPPVCNFRGAGRGRGLCLF